MKILPKYRKISNTLKEPIVFYCKDCEKIGSVKPVGRKFDYKCAVCNTKNVAFGTEKSIINYYRIEEEKKPKEKVEKSDGVVKKKEEAPEPEKKETVI